MSLATLTPTSTVAAAATAAASSTLWPSSLLPSPTATSPSTLAPVSDEVFSCKLVGPFSILVQVLVGTLGFSTLIIKRHFESPRRPWLVWSFDVSKQVIGGSMMHMSNLLVSALIGGGAGESQTNPCSWYVLNLTLDCTLGILIITGYLKVFGMLARRYSIKGLESGHYGDPPNWRWWLKQAGMFCTGMIFMKLTVVFLISVLPFLVRIGDGILKPVQLLHSPRFEIVFVMAIWPLTLNIFESWVIDQFIKRKHDRRHGEISSGHVPLESIDGHHPSASFELSNSSGSSRTLRSDSVHDAQFSIDLPPFDSADDDDGDDDGYDDDDEGYAQQSKKRSAYAPVRQHRPSKKDAGDHSSGALLPSDTRYNQHHHERRYSGSFSDEEDLSETYKPHKD